MFRVLTFAKPEQPEPRNTLAHEGLTNITTEKNVISSLLYTFLSNIPGLNDN